jgi:hypothetical protein
LLLDDVLWVKFRKACILEDVHKMGSLEVVSYATVKLLLPKCRTMEFSVMDAVASPGRACNSCLGQIRWLGQFGTNKTSLRRMGM